MRKLLVCLLFLCIGLFSCVESTPCVSITNGEELTLEIGESVKLEATHNFDTTSIYKWYAMNSCALVNENGFVTAVKEGVCIVKVAIDNYKDEIIINVVDTTPITISLSVDNSSLYVGETATLNAIVEPMKPSSGLYYEIVNESDAVIITDNTVKAVKVGTAYIVAKFEEFVSNQIIVEVKEEELIDPYETVTYEDFYQNYTPATSSTDAYFRSLHGFMSGDISKQDQSPTLAHYQPMEDGKYVRNISSIYSSDGLTYYIVDG